MTALSVSQLLGQNLKSVQRGLTPFSGSGPYSIPINAVDVSRTQVRMLGTRRTDAGEYYISQSLALQNASLFLASANALSFIIDSGVPTGVFSWEVAEYF